ILESWRPPVRLRIVPNIFLVSERERRLFADTKLSRARIDDPVEATDVRVVNAVTIQVTTLRAPGGALCWRRCPSDRHRCRPEIAVGIAHPVRQSEFLWRDVLQELIVLVDDFDVDVIAVCI